MSKKPDDAVRVAGLASILQAGNKQNAKPAAPPSPAPAPVEVSAPADTPVPRPKRGKVGKYRDPNWHHYGVYLRKDTHKRASRQLEDLETGQDMSELLQELLERWLASQ